MFGGAAAKCPRCNKSVYAAEEMLGLGKKWHKMCFKCNKCGRSLDSTTLAEHDGEIYCRPCHAKEWGPKGYGYGGGAGTLSNTGVDSSGGTAPSAAKAPAAAAPSSGEAKFCGNCGTKADGGKFCGSCGSALGGGGGGAPASAAPSAAQAEISREPVASVSRNPFKTAAPAAGLGGGNPLCGHCGKPVYHAERITGAGKEWHKTCFKCKSCGKSVDSTTATDKNNEIYCKSCYAKEFGPKGYGYGGGAGTLSHTQ